MKVIIMAAGLGTRLRPITDKIPKIMLPLAGKPLLTHHLEHLKRSRIDEIGVNLNYLADSVVDYYGNGKQLGVNIFYSLEKEIMGTAGGVKLFENWIDGKDFLVIYGDVYTEIDFNKFILFAIKKGGLGTLGLKSLNDARDKGIVEIDVDYRVINFAEKPITTKKFCTKLINGGIYYFTSDIFKHIPENVFCDFGLDVFPNLIENNHILWGYIIEEMLEDVGTHEKYKFVQQYLKSK